MVEFTCGAIWSCSLFVGSSFYYWFNFITGNCSVNILFLPESDLGDCTFLGICPFLLGCPFYWCIILHSNLLWCFVFLSYLLSLLFHFWFYLFGSFFYFTWWVWLKVYQFFFIFSKNQLCFIDIFYFLSLFLLFPLDHYFFSSTNLGFVCSSFYCSFRCDIRLFEIFLVSWGRIVLL